MGRLRRRVDGQLTGRRGVLDDEAASIAAAGVADGAATYFDAYRDYATTSAYIDTLIEKTKATPETTPGSVSGSRILTKR